MPLKRAEALGSDARRREIHHGRCRHRTDLRRRGGNRRSLKRSQAAPDRNKGAGYDEAVACMQVSHHSPPQAGPTTSPCDASSIDPAATQMKKGPRAALGDFLRPFLSN